MVRVKQKKLMQLQGALKSIIDLLLYGMQVWTIFGTMTNTMFSNCVFD